ncbi:helix-turn-helix transcriptional regulator [Streptomyces sp. NPDC006365]|uniref:helix-turn-helix domain-containing protein n=1 Tax=Streptomyces sp. NPDC006365 TaxID=3364744 RepID=UPI00368AFBE6
MANKDAPIPEFAPFRVIDLIDRLSKSRVEALTPREREVISLLGGGASNRSIATMLGITERTVKAHIPRITDKLDVNGRYKAAVVAVLESTGTVTGPGGR